MSIPLKKSTMTKITPNNCVASVFVANFWSSRRQLFDSGGLYFGLFRLFQQNLMYKYDPYNLSLKAFSLDSAADLTVSSPAAGWGGRTRRQYSR